MSENAENKDRDDREDGIFAAIEKNDVAALKALLVGKEDVNVFDENLMTPLQHAAYKGNLEMVQLLLDQGADVNLCKHAHNYTALHFAGLSSNREICQILLAAGAKPDVTNSVGRTPAQMAAFVGNHSCVATINTYISRSEIDRYSKGLLPADLAESFHKFVTCVNVHPVRVVLNLQVYRLSEVLKEVREVLEQMRGGEMKKGVETNEVMAFKFHYLYFIVSEIFKMQKKLKEKPQEDESKSDPVELFAKKLLKDPNFTDSFLRESVREFPYRDCTIFRQMVASLADKNSPSAVSVISAAINGQRGFVDQVVTCSTCGEEKPAKKCSKCKVVQYCDRGCQRLHWPVHKKECARLGKDGEGEIAEKGRPDAGEIAEGLRKLGVN